MTHTITFSHKPHRHAATLLALSAALACCPEAFAQPKVNGSPANVETISVYVGRSRLLPTPWPVKAVSITDPAIANVEVLTARQVLVQAKAAGTTDIIMLSDRGEEVLQLQIDVSVDVARIKSELDRLFPDSDLTVKQSGDVITVTGRLSRAEQTDRLHRFLETSGVKYVDMTSLAGVQQVQVQVRIAESSRVALRALGINVLQAGHQDNTFFGASLVGNSAGGALNPVSIGPPAGAIAGIGGGTAVQTPVPFTFNADVTVSPLVTILAGFPRADLEFFVQALAENQYLRILAEPNLVALSGEEASFLAGGEFPIPVVQGTTGGAAGGTAITIEYKEFGVRLNFRPIVQGDGSILMYVAPEVSDLSDQGAVEIQGFRVPSLVTRRAETTLELQSGQTFAMAGLLLEANQGTNSRVPGLGDIPILGTLFSSKRYEKRETELVVLVTASLVEPLSIDDVPATPGDDHVVPNDWELYAEGKVEGGAVSPYDTPRSAPRPASTWVQAAGLGQLRGPGAWTSYETPPAESTAVAAAPIAPKSDQDAEAQ